MDGVSRQPSDSLVVGSVSRSPCEVMQRPEWIMHNLTRGCSSNPTAGRELRCRTNISLLSFGMWKIGTRTTQAVVSP